jgi:Single domain von Willebrand factor type C
MNFRLSLVIGALSCFLLASAYTPEMVFNTKVKNADGEDVCFYKNVQVSPGEAKDVPGECLELYCGQDFSIAISGCFVDPKCHWLGPDNTKAYPVCCGIRLCS